MWGIGYYCEANRQKGIDLEVLTYDAKTELLEEYGLGLISQHGTRGTYDNGIPVDRTFDHDLTLRWSPSSLDIQILYQGRVISGDECKNLKKDSYDTFEWVEDNVVQNRLISQPKIQKFLVISHYHPTKKDKAAIQGRLEDLNTTVIELGFQMIPTMDYRTCLNILKDKLRPYIYAILEGLGIPRPITMGDLYREAVSYTEGIPQPIRGPMNLWLCRTWYDEGILDPASSTTYESETNRTPVEGGMRYLITGDSTSDNPVCDSPIPSVSEYRSSDSEHKPTRIGGILEGNEGNVVYSRGDSKIRSGSRRHSPATRNTLRRPISSRSRWRRAYFDDWDGREALFHQDDSGHWHLVRFI